MRLRTLFIAASTALISTMGIAGEPVEQRFTRDGRTYVYTTTVIPDGRTLIAGRELVTSSRFRLLVKGDKVSGYTDGRPVRFRAAQPLAAMEVAAN